LTRLRLSDKERAKYLEDPAMKRWIARLEKGSAKTAAMWPSGLVAFFHLTGTTPSKVAKMTKTQLVDLAESYEKAERDRGTMASTIAARLGFLRNFVQYVGDERLPVGTFKVKGANLATEEPALTREQLRAIDENANVRERVLLSLRGLRPGSIGNFDGTDGLRVGDVRGMRIEGTTVSFDGPVSFAMVRPELSKAGNRYFFPFGEEAQGRIRAYLEQRIRKGETITKESALIVTDGGRFPRSSEVGDYIRTAMQRAKVEARPYALRTTWETRISEAENDSAVSHEYRLAWAGRRGADTSAIYSVNRGLLDEKTFARMAESYRRCEPYLAMTEKVDTKAELLGSLAKAIEQATGKSSGNLKGDDLVRAIRDALGSSTTEEPAFAAPAPEKPAILPAKRVGEQRSIDAEVVGSYLDAGWSFKSPLNSHLAVVEWTGPAA
jgi:site-specific recombinase XerC